MEKEVNIMEIEKIELTTSQRLYLGMVFEKEVQRVKALPDSPEKDKLLENAINIYRKLN